MLSRLALCAALLLAPTGYAAACNVFAHESDPSVTLSDNDRWLTLRFGDKVLDFEVEDAEYLGLPIKVAFDPEGIDGRDYYFQRTNIRGLEVLVFESMLFFKRCGDPA